MFSSEPCAESMRVKSVRGLGELLQAASSAIAPRATPVHAHRRISFSVQITFAIKLPVAPVQNRPWSRFRNRNKKGGGDSPIAPPWRYKRQKGTKNGHSACHYPSTAQESLALRALARQLAS